MTAATIISVDGDPVIRALSEMGVNLTKQIGIINWKVGRKTKSIIAKQVTQELSVAQKIVKAQITARKMPDRSAKVELKKSSRIPLRDFGARQTKKGVSYRTSKSKGRKTLAGAFKGPKPGLTFVRFGGHVMIRMGIARLPIKKLYGPSPWGVHVKNNQQQPVVQQINAELRKQKYERLRYLRLKQTGAI